MEIFNRQTKSIDSAAIILGTAFLISAILGLIRDRLLAGTFGIGDELDIYYTAFRIPDFITMVLLVGAISAAIIPIFTEQLIKSKPSAFKYLSNLLNSFLIILIIICGILFIFAPQVISIIAPGFCEDKKMLVVALTRIMLFSPILLGISNIISGILRVFKRFLITALCPIMYNLGIIIGIIFFVPIMGIKGLAWGVVLGGGLHLLIQLPILYKLGFRMQKILDFRDANFIKTIKLTIPRSIGLMSSQINLIIVTVIASGLAKGSIGVFNLAEGLSRPILSLIAISFSVAAFPALSLSYSQNNQAKFKSIFNSVFYKILGLSLGASTLVFIFRQAIVDIIYQTGEFSAMDSALCSACLGMFCIGIFAQGLILLLAKAFYARQNTKIPALASIMGTLINIILCLYFVYLLSFANSFQQWTINFLGIQGLQNIEIIGLPLALSVSGIFQFLLLLIFYKIWYNKHGYDN
jgi:putative peptidoglycan lipid II flippase